MEEPKWSNNGNVDEHLIMPHLSYSVDQLDAMHPPLQAPPEEPFDDLDKDEDDIILQAGKAIAQNIAYESERFGRRKHAPAQNSHTIATLTYSQPSRNSIHANGRPQSIVPAAVRKEAKESQWTVQKRSRAVRDAARVARPTRSMDVSTGLTTTLGEVLQTAKAHTGRRKTRGSEALEKHRACGSEGPTHA